MRVEVIENVISLDDEIPVNKGSKFEVEESWARFNRKVFKVVRGGFIGLLLPVEDCVEVQWEDYTKEEKIQELMKELKEHEDKVSYHDGQKFVYMNKCADVLDELHELGVEVF